MLNSNNGWKPVVDQEAAKLGKSQAIADQFLAAMLTAAKGGSYTNGASCPGGGSCVAQLIRRTGAGRVAVPRKTAGGIVLREFVYGSFFDGVLCFPTILVRSRMRVTVQFGVIRKHRIEYSRIDRSRSLHVEVDGTSVTYFLDNRRLEVFDCRINGATRCRWR